MIILLGFLPPRHERRNWLKYVGLQISVVKFDVNDGVSLSSL